MSKINILCDSRTLMCFVTLCTMNVRSLCVSRTSGSSGAINYLFNVFTQTVFFSSPWMQAELSVKIDESQTSDDRQKHWRHIADGEQAAAGDSATSSANASPNGGGNESGTSPVNYGSSSSSSSSSRQVPPDRRRSIAALVSSTVVRHPRFISTRTSLDSIKSSGSNSDVD
jgi:hypothetical protein